MVKIGVISDTHGLLREEVLEILRDCDCVFHGGDINNQGVLDALGKIAPVYVVRGNNDKEWAEQLPHDLTVRMEGRKIFMVHNRKEIENLPEDADIVIFGHSHKYFEQVIDGRLWLNPGSCGKRRFGQEISLAVLTVDGKDYQVRKIVLPME
ncbi:MAG: metallophosphoesterase family protein [Oscillospiraceae bacterium]